MTETSLTPRAARPAALSGRAARRAERLAQQHRPPWEEKPTVPGQAGKVMVKKDEVADDKFLSGINFYIKGVEGKVPSGK